MGKWTHFAGGNPTVGAVAKQGHDLQKDTGLSLSSVFRYWHLQSNLH